MSIEAIFQHKRIIRNSFITHFLCLIQTNLCAMRAMHTKVVYVPICPCANVLKVCENLIFTANVPTFYRPVNFSTWRGNVPISQLCLIFSNLKNIWTILKNICKVSLRKCKINSVVVEVLKFLNKITQIPKNIIFSFYWSTKDLKV